MNTQLITKWQKGISIVELMITLVIASVLILGIVQVYVDNRRNNLFQQNQMVNLDNTRFTLLILDSILEKAGYRRAPDELYETAFPRDTNVNGCSTFERGAAITTLSDNSIGFCMRYQPAFSGELDCAGAAVILNANDNLPFKAVDNNELVIQAIRFVPGANNRLEAGRLECARIIQGSAPNFAEIVTGVADFRVGFGISNSPNSINRQIDRIVAASAWNPTLDGPPLSIRYEALMASLPNQRTSDSTQLTFWKSKGSEAANTRLENQDAGHLYQISSNSNAIRNLAP